MNAPEPRPSRRTFGRVLAALAAMPLAMSSSARTARGEAEPAVTVAQSLAEIARLRYGKYLSEEQLNEVRRGISRSLFSANLLHQVKLRNSDEPAVIFRADVP
jgi:hypothetical protein